jgi:hypothetical protein
MHLVRQLGRLPSERVAVTRQVAIIAVMKDSDFQFAALDGDGPRRDCNPRVHWTCLVRLQDAAPANALVVESADTLRSERSDASRAGANPAEGTRVM